MPRSEVRTLPRSAEVCRALALVVTEVGHSTRRLDLKLHMRRHDEELAFAKTLPFAAGQFGLERAGHDVHVLFAIRAKTVFAGLDHADRRRTVRRGHGEALNFSFKI